MNSSGKSIDNILILTPENEERQDLISTRQNARVVERLPT